MAEVIGLTLRFDLATLPPTAWWSGPLRTVPGLFRLGSLIAIVTLGLNWSWSRHALSEALTRGSGQRVRYAALVAHLVTMGIFAALTRHIFEGDALSSAGATWWVLSWFTAGGLTMLFWAAAMFPLTVWVALVRQRLLGGVIVGSVAWGAAFFARDLWQPLSRGTFWGVERLLEVLFGDVVSRPEELVVGTSSFQIEIAPVCSGVEGIGLITAFLLAYCWYARNELRFPRAFLLLPIGITLIWCANVLRIAALVAIGAWGWQDVALGGFHSQVGWLAFIGVSLGLVAVTQRLTFFRTSPAVTGTNPAVAYLSPLMTILATGMIAGALSSGFDWLYPARVLTGGIALWLVRDSFTRLKWEWSWWAVLGGWAVFWLWLIIERPQTATEGNRQMAHALGDVPRGWAVVWVAFRVAGSVVTVPLAEELAFRGYVTRRLIAADFERVPFGRLTWFSFLVSSVLFGVLHDRWVAGTIAGMVYALILARRGRFSDAVLAHATTNALIAIYVLATGEWSLWS